MLNTSRQISSEILVQHNLSTNSLHSTQHGPLSFPDCLPAEGIARITCFLDPHSLLSLDRVNKLLHAHVADDVTWQRAFLWRFLSIGPETHLSDTDSLLLRRSHSTWRKEYLARYDILRRWRLSRNSTIQHAPLHSTISGIYLMPPLGLLSCSIAHGVVARSVPLTGKIYRGYLDAAGTGGGLGIGNPNVEFTPNVTCCAMSSEGGTAKIAWGFRSGEVCVLTANRAMDPSQRSAASVVRSKVNEDHTSMVHDIVWAESKAAIIVSASEDGFVKVWDPRKVKCLWTSARCEITPVIPDPCLHLAVAMNAGVIVAVTKSGQTVVFYNFEQVNSHTNDVVLQTHAVLSVAIPCLAMPDDPIAPEVPSVLELAIDPSCCDPTFLVSYKDHPCFYQVVIQKKGVPVVTSFGDRTYGAKLTSLAAQFGKTAEEDSFVLAGDSFGCVSVYAWRASTSMTHAIRHIEVFPPGSSVSALAWNGAVLVVGSAYGSLEVFDGVALTHTRELSYIPSRRPRDNGPRFGAINQILLGPDKDTVFASTGDNIVGFRAAPISMSRGGVRGRHNGPLRKKDKSNVKYRERLELNETIADERVQIEKEQAYVRRVYDKEKEQLNTLATLGLSETEAIEYALMLSRDEASAKTPLMDPSVQENIVLGDFDDIPRNSNVSEPRQQVSSSPESPKHIAVASSSSSGMAIPIVTPLTSHQKIQVSPWATAESPEAGLPGQFQASSFESSSGRSATPNSASERDFPAFSSSHSSPKSPLKASGAGDISKKSAWGSPLQKGSPPRLTGTSGTAARTVVPKAKTEEVMDDEMRLAIELSLVEAEADAKRRATQQ